MAVGLAFFLMVLVPATALFMYILLLMTGGHK